MNKYLFIIILLLTPSGRRGVDFCYEAEKKSNTTWGFFYAKKWLSCVLFDRFHYIMFVYLKNRGFFSDFIE